MSTEREQKLVDICFQIAATTRDHVSFFENHPDHMSWVADQLRQCGFDTEPCGMSWGILKNE